MKKIIKIGFAFLFVIAINACSRFEDPIFDTPSAERINEAIKTYNEILESAPYGWSMDYYYGDILNPEGGYKMLVKFKDGKVDLASEVSVTDYPAGTTLTSSYSFASDQGPILSFDSFNPIIHYFAEATPSQTLGLGGDFEFIMQSVTPQKVILRGKKNGHRVVLRPLNEEKDPKEYISKINALKDQLNKLMRFEISVGGNASTSAINLDHSRWYDTDYPEKVIRYSVSDEGIDLQVPFTMDGKEYDEFVYDEANKVLHAKNQEQFKLTSVRLEYADIPGKYKLSYVSNLGSRTEEVQITENVVGQSYILTSKTFIKPIQLEYVNGNLIFRPQDLGPAPNGADGNLWMTIGYDGNLIGIVIPVYEMNPQFIMGGLWMRGSKENPVFDVLSQYTFTGIFGTFSMKYLALHKAIGTKKEFYSNHEGVNLLYNVKLTKL